MFYRASTSVAALGALLAACCGLIEPTAFAGDRIAFSPPSALAVLEVPRLERVIKQDSESAISRSFASQDAADPAYVPVATVIIPLQKPRNRFGWTAPFEDSRDQDDRSGLDLFAPRKSPTQAKSSSGSKEKNSRGSDDKDSRDPNNKDSRVSDDKDSDLTGDTDSSDSDDKDSVIFKGGNGTDSDFGRSRFGMDGNQKDTDRGEKRFSSRFEDRVASDWSARFDSHGATGSERVREGAFATEGEDFSTLYQRSLGGLSQSSPLGPTDPLHSSAYSFGDSGNEMPAKSLRGQTEQEALMQPSMVHAWDALPSAASPLQSFVPEPSFSAPTFAPSAPAVLGFPKRPGDLFQ